MSNLFKIKYISNSRFAVWWCVNTHEISTFFFWLMFVSSLLPSIQKKLREQDDYCSQAEKWHTKYIREKRGPWQFNLTNIRIYRSFFKHFIRMSSIDFCSFCSSTTTTTMPDKTSHKLRMWCGIHIKGFFFSFSLARQINEWHWLFNFWRKKSVLACFL